MTIDVTVPFRGVDKDRRRACAIVQAHLASTFDTDVQLVDSGRQPFAKAESMNQACSASDADVLVVCDADTLIPAAQLHAAVDAATEGDGQVVPYDRLMWLASKSTREVEAMGRVPEPGEVPAKWTWRPSSRIPLLGGCAVMTRATWQRVGGWPEWFVGWGCQDVTFAAMCSTLVAPMRRLKGAGWHLFHTKHGAYNKRSKINGEHMREVLATQGDPEAMRAVLADRRRAESPPSR